MAECGMNSYRLIHLLRLTINFRYFNQCAWFQHFKYNTYSVGVIYAVIINLPRAMHYKNENI